jgi:hypothetical protein
MADLDFKFVVHHGEMVKQKMGGREELAGRDVILVHRLLKNAVGERIGGRAYALYGDAAMRSMGVGWRFRMSRRKLALGLRPEGGIRFANKGHAATSESTALPCQGA